MSWDGTNANEAGPPVLQMRACKSGSQLEESKQRSRVSASREIPGGIEVWGMEGQEKQVSPSGFPPYGHSRPGTRLALINHHDHDCAAKLPR